MGWLGFFFEFRDRVFKDYSGLFGGRGEIIESGEEDEEDPATYEEVQLEKFNKQWMWYDMVAKLADEDLLKMKEYWGLELKSLLNHLSYKISKTNLKR